MTTLENEFLRVSIRSKGAELTSLFHKATGTEHLWAGDPNVWGWHAPNLFPVVGGCLNDEIRVKGKAYPMGRHGFARQSEFTVVEATPTQATFSLRSTEKTLAVYPYRFDFRITYALAGKRLTITYQVRNEGDETMYFSVGAHPAFNVPFISGEAYTDYYLEFDADKTLERHLLSGAGYFTGQTETIRLENQQLRLTKNRFDQDALVFKSLQSRQVTLWSNNHDRGVTVSYPDFPYLGIWAKPGAPFVCIEPWLGCADTEGKGVELANKEAIQHVDAGKRFSAAFSVDIH